MGATCLGGHVVQRPDGAEDGDVSVDAGVTLNTDGYRGKLVQAAVRYVRGMKKVYRGPG
jgi:hypothetical protein